MHFTFECGVCHATYRLDDQQITSRGVKITCPKCLNYFLLKKGSVDADDVPVIEHVVADGPKEIETPPPPEGEPTVHDLLEEKEEPEPAPELPPKEEEPPLVPTATVERDPLPVEDLVRPTSRGMPEKSDTEVKPQELSDYPEEEPAGSGWDRWLYMAAFILILLVGAAYLHYRGTISIPGLSGWRKPLPADTRIPEAENPTESPDAEKQTPPKYGFPQSDPKYDPWKDE